MSPDDDFSDDELHAEYAVAWSLHNLVPFADKLLGIAGAMDQRPIAAADWYVRLPLSLVVCVFPTRKDFVAVAHVANVCFWAARMPVVWDYMCWVALTELCYLCAVLRHRGEASCFMRRAFLPAARALLVTLYASAAFWKLTTSFLTPETSCATTLVAELAAALFGDTIATGGAFAKGLMASAPAQIVAIEVIVPALMVLGSRAAVPIACLFHFTINLMPVTYAGGFSIAMCARLVIFLPGSLAGGARALRRAAAEGTDVADGTAGAALVLAVAAAAYGHAHRGGFDSAGALFLALAAAYVRRALFHDDPVEAPASASDAPLRNGAVACGAFYGFAAPILGIMAMASSSMYGNLRQFDGAWGNHLLVPTGVLQRLAAGADPSKSAFGDAFGGGVVRLERKGTSGSVFEELYFDADITDEQPPFARELLRDAVPGHPTRYFEFYAARNYFNRDGDHAETALHNDNGLRATAATKPAPAPAALAMPSYELRRALDLARQRGEPFSVKYAKLSSKTPSSWRVEKVSKADAISYAFPAGKCRDGNGRACAPDELAMLPPPPTWLTFLLHPYPVPLLDDGSGDEVHCTT